LANEHLGLRIGFRNDTTGELAEIVWRVRFGGAWVDFRDRGPFAPGMTVTHTLNAPLLTDRIGRFEDAINNCSVADVQSAAGTEWQAPGFSARLLYSIPTPRPDDVTPLPANIDNPTHDPVGIVGCVAEVDRGRTRGIGRKNGVALLGVRFRNLSSEPIDQIVFRVWYLSGGVDFIEGGIFSPGTLISSPAIQHPILGPPAVLGHLSRLDLPVTTPVDFIDTDDDPNNCATVRVHFVDGTVWQNPGIGPTEPPLPTAPPTLAPN
jgi:hypothetical protein